VNTIAQKLGCLIERSGFKIMLAGAAAALSLGGYIAWSRTQIREPPSLGSQQRLRLLTQEQYLNSLRYVFGPDVRPETNFAAVQRIDGLLSVGTTFAGITDSQLEIYQKTAAAVAAQVVRPESRSFLVPCKPTSEEEPDATCASEFLSNVGRLLYRRPLGSERLAALVQQADQTSKALKSFYAGLEIALEGLLLSPDTLLVVETAQADPDHPGRQRLDGYSLASRLSLFLWNAAPDDELLKAAESGALVTRRGREHEVDRMLASPRFEAGVRAFFDDMFGLDATRTLAKDSVIYPAFTSVTAQDSREQTLRTVVDHLLTRHGDYRDLFTTRRTFLSPSLAAIYELPAGPGWTPYEFPEGSPRSGLLTQISFLALHSHPGRSSATKRGKALRELLLCQDVPRPPPDVDFSAVENPDANLHTARERVGAHLKNPTCAGCHRVTDPTGLALESFDGAGRYREEESGVKLDTTGNLDGRPFKDVVGLGSALHDNPSLGSCLVKRAYSYAVGAPTASRDRAVLRYLGKQFVSDGYRVPELFRAIAVSEAFVAIAPERVRRTPPVVTAQASLAPGASPPIVLAY
jgi:hypothetical protein